MDLYTLFVENLFGGFWLSVFSLSIIYALMLAFGSVSGYSIMLFLMVFLLAMSLGYGVSLVSVTITLFIATWFIIQLVKSYDN